MANLLDALAQARDSSCVHVWSDDDLSSNAPCLKCGKGWAKAKFPPRDLKVGTHDQCNGRTGSITV